MKIVLNIPIAIVSELNLSDHWSKKRQRNLSKRIFIRAYWKKHQPKVNLPCTVHLIRISPRQLDDDNLVGAFKSVRDTIADLIIPGLAKGRADGDLRIHWMYGQEKGKSGFRIEVECNDVFADIVKPLYMD